MGRLSTKDRLKKWSVIQGESCEFCDGNESIEHLFFSCEYMKVVWSKMLMYPHMYHAHSSCRDELEWLIGHCKGKSLKAKMCRASFCCVIYCIWMERNKRIFKNEKKSIEELLLLCVNTIRNKVYSWKNIANTRKNWDLCIEWGLPLSIFKNG
ncbi:hypothetical protein LIER_43983 [Lithospermum erythrorhizon]|uniref:Reverse transcriptase zinc-binding domain-containing protein n=1 Tax=Lithospermum erythrorhizon TaxID=34254 RepID=A0AAV3RH07_LITER